MKVFRTPDEVNEIIKIRKAVKPDMENHELYRPLKEKYTDLYLATREIMHRD